MQRDEIISIYPWIDNALFERIIKQDYPNAIIKVRNFDVKSALPPGENYASIMIRASVTYDIDGMEVVKGFIIKAGHTKPELKAVFDDLNVFTNEIKMFTVILPAMEKLLRDVGDDTKFSAKFYECSGENDYLIFEDLTERNYRNVNRRFGLNVEQFKQALLKIAKFHACAAVLQTQSYSFDDMRINNMTSEVVQKFNTNLMVAAAKLAKTKPKLQHLSAKLEANIDKVNKKIEEFVQSKETDFVTLRHGDLWMNNIMFQFNDAGSTVEAILVDYQCPCVAPVVLDVLNTLYSSSHEDLRDREWDILVQYYHRILSETLAKLHYTKPIPTLTQIQMQVLEKGVCYATTVIGSSGFRNIDSKGEDVADFVSDDDDKGAGFMIKMMDNPVARKSVEFGLDYANRKGYLD